MRAKEVDIKELIQACLANNPQAQFELYSRYSKAMYSIAVRMLGNTPEAEDALQDAFVNAFKNLKKFDNRVSFGAWLRRILINVCLNKLRQKKLKWLELDFDIPVQEPLEETQINPKELHAAVEKLPSGCKAVFVLKAFEGYRHEDISKELGISLSTSKSQFIRAKKILSYSLQKLMEIKNNG